MTGDVTDTHDDMLLVLKVHRRIIAADAYRWPKITDDFDVPTPLVGRNHASVDEFGDTKVPLTPQFCGSARKRWCAWSIRLV